jgi:hypothetical protein
LTLTFSFGTTVRDYFGRYASSPETAYAFEAAATELAAEINRFTGRGWDGQGMVVPREGVNHKRRVYLDTRLWQAWEGLSFLVPEQQALVRFQPNSVPSLPSAEPILLLLWPYDDLRPYLAALPHPAQIEAHAGPLTRGDLEREAYPGYASYLVEPLTGQQPLPLFRFGESIQLTDLAIEREERTWHVRLHWSAQARLDEDYTVFVCVCHDQCAEDELIAQDDAQPGDGYYPTHVWRPGDVVVDVHTLDLPPSEPTASTIAVGLYTWPSLERLPVTTPSGTSVGDMVVVSVGDGSDDTD